MNELVTTSAVNVQELIAQAIDKNVSVETMERMLAMAERVQAEQARNDFIIARSKFQAECPTIKKTHEVKNNSGKVLYRYAKIEDIVEQVSPFLEKYGFSHSFDTQIENNQITVTCTAQHRTGHSEKSSFPVPIESQAFMNDAQKAGTASSYGKRYSFCNVFGITTADEDDDAQSLGKGIDPNDLYKKFSFVMKSTLENYESIKAIKDFLSVGEVESAAEAWAEIPEDERMNLNLAPTKGGPFTVEESKVMVSVEFKEHFYARKKAD